MNRVILPLILLAVIAIAAGFAFAPVDKAVTIHDDMIIDHANHFCQANNNNASKVFNSISGLCE